MVAERPAALRSSRVRRVPSIGVAGAIPTAARPASSPCLRSSPTNASADRCPTAYSLAGLARHPDTAALPLWRKGGTRPLRPSTRSARSSATSKTTASSGDLSQMNVTTQSLQASLPCMMHPSHSIVSVAMWSRLSRACDQNPELDEGRHYGREGMVTTVAPGGGTKVDAGGFEL